MDYNTQKLLGIQDLDITFKEEWRKRAITKYMKKVPELIDSGTFFIDNSSV